MRQTFFDESAGRFPTARNGPNYWLSKGLRLSIQTSADSPFAIRGKKLNVAHLVNSTDN
jgi:hypothetical protein